MRSPILIAACVSLLTPFMTPSSVSAQGMTDRDGYAIVGVRLSERERRESRPVRLPDGRVVLRPVSQGLGFLYGFGDSSGRPSSLPTINGVTPSIEASTPSGGLVPGQEPR